MTTKFIGGAISLTASDVVIFKHLRMWAERGLIHIEDSRDNSYESVSVLTMLWRMKAIMDMLKNSTRREKGSFDQFDHQTHDEHQQMIERMVEVTNKAKVQGMPSDASARRDLKRRRRTVVAVSEYGGGL